MISSLHQPIHTVYGGAHLFKSTTCSKLGALAKKAFHDYAPDAATMAKVFGIDGLESLVHTRVSEKLGREPIEDYRIDFEDGFGVRSDAEEDAAADNAAREVTAAVQAKSLPGMFGIRVKSFHSAATKARALRTLDRFLSQATLPENFVVTLPKITAPEQVSELVRALAALSRCAHRDHDRDAGVDIHTAAAAGSSRREMPRCAFRSVRLHCEPGYCRGGAASASSSV